MAAGSEQAFADLFRRYGPIANGLAIRIIGDAALAEDVLQEVFLSVWHRARSYDPARGSLRSWLLAQVHHRAVDAVRREEAERRRLARQTVEPKDEIDDVVEEDWVRTRGRQVRRALAALPREQRAVLELAYYGGLTQTQIAERTGAPLGTVKSRTAGGLRALRAALGSPQR